MFIFIDRRTNGWVPEQKISVREAIQCYTINSAYASFEENLKGTLETGKLADMVLLDGDPFTVSPDAIKE